MSAVGGETGSHPVLDLLDLPLSPIADQPRHSSKCAQTVRQKADTPDQKRPLNQPQIGAQYQVCDNQRGHYENKGGKVDVKTHDLGHLPLRKSQFFLLVHDVHRSCPMGLRLRWPESNPS